MPVPGFALVLAAALASAQPDPASHAGGAAVPLPGAGAPTATGVSEEVQYWLGTIDLPDQNTPRMTVVVTLRRGGRGDGPGGEKVATTWAGTLDIPRTLTVPGAVAVPLSGIEVGETTIRFASPASPAGENIYEVERSPGAAEATGRLTIADAGAVPLSLRRVSAAVASRYMIHRPQAAVPPFPYTATGVTVPVGVDLRLAGTLVVPGGAAPAHGRAAVVLIGDTGPLNRDQEDAFHRPFAVIADDLARAGVASLRMDDRGMGNSGGDYGQTTIADRVADARAAMGFLAAQAGVDAGRIGVIGLGEGAHIAALAAGAPASGGGEGRGVPGAAFLVLLSPQGTPGPEVVAQRERRRLEVEGEDPAFITTQAERRRLIAGLLASGAEEAAVRSAIREEVAAFSDARRLEGDAMPEAVIEKTVRDQHEAARAPRYLEWLRSDPFGAINRVRCPVLVLSGSLDALTPARENFPPVRAAVKGIPGGHSSAVLLPGVNHWLQPATTGDPGERVQIETTIAPEALRLIREFVQALEAP